MKNKFSIVALVSLVALATYCSNEYFGRYLTRGGTNEPASVTQTCANNGDCEVVNTYNPQADNPGSTPVAVVIVGDTSASMGNNFEATADALTGWLTHFQDIGLENFCFAFMPGHAGRYSGRYFSPDADHPKCMCTSDYSVAEISDKMGYTLRHYPTSDLLADGVTSAFTQGGEVTLYSMHHALTDPDAHADNLAAGCFPSQYAVAFVGLNDENDAMSAVDGTDITNCAGVFYSGPNDAFDTLDMGTIQFDNSEFPAAVAAGGDWNTTSIAAANYNHPDGQCKEVQTRLSWYSETTPTGPGGTYKLTVTPQSIADELVAFNGILPSFASAVGTVPKDFVADGQAGPYWGFIELADIFGQDIANIKYAGVDQDAFNEELDTLAEAMAQTVSFIYGFDLFDEDGDLATVCADEIDNVVVKINGSVVDPDDWTLNAPRNRVNFDPGYMFDFGDVVTVEFNTCD